MSKTTPLPRRRSSGCVIFRKEDNNVDVLLVTSSRSSDKWILPKGGVSLALSERDSAAKEAYEEAGALGTIGLKLGDYRYVKDSIVHDVSMFAMSFSHFAGNWPESHVRRREWFDARKAMQMVDPYLAYFINELVEAVEADHAHESNKKANNSGTL